MYWGPGTRSFPSPLEAHWEVTIVGSFRAGEMRQGGSLQVFIRDCKDLSSCLAKGQNIVPTKRDAVNTEAKTRIDYTNISHLGV